MLENLSQDPHHPALVRFGDLCPLWLHSTDDFALGTVRRDRTHALICKYIELYERRRTHIVLDVDRRNAIFTAEDHNLPPPTLTVVNPLNRHAHLFYELNTPVSFGKRSKQQPQDYFHAVKHALTTKAHADASFAHHMAKNPLHEAWETYAIDRSYDLAELAEYLKLERKSTVHPIAHKRNCTVFETVRYWAYARIHQDPNWPSSKPPSFIKPFTGASRMRMLKSMMTFCLRFCNYLKSTPSGGTLTKIYATM